MCKGRAARICSLRLFSTTVIDGLSSCAARRASLCRFGASAHADIPPRDDEITYSLRIRVDTAIFKQVNSHREHREKSSVSSALSVLSVAIILHTFEKRRKRRSF
jgi:hypothetical protein